MVLGKRNLYKYFDFFPTNDDKYGKVNVWGYATVVKSANPSLQVGERIFGYFPLAKYAILLCPEAMMRDGSFQAQREKDMPADWRVYNDYHRLTKDPHYDPRYENQILIFRPLWWTSYFLSDFLEENNFFGASTVVISSASAKTAFGLAFLLKDKRRVVGLTSARGKPFVQSLNTYHQVLLYDELNSLSVDASEKALYVDVAGDAKLLSAVHGRLGAQLAMVIQVGLSHWDQVGQNITPKESFPFPSQVFFCPQWIKKRGVRLCLRCVFSHSEVLIHTSLYYVHVTFSLSFFSFLFFHKKNYFFQHDLGPELSERMATAWQLLLDNVEKWVTIKSGRGEEAVSKVYNSLITGQVNPNEGFVLSLWEDKPLSASGDYSKSS